MQWKEDCLLKVLYLEDDAEDAEMLKDALHHIPAPRFFVTHLTRSSEASLYVAYEDYDVVICDYFLHLESDLNCTCEGFVQNLRRERPGVILVITTGNIDVEQISPSLRAAIASGAIGFLFKHDWSPEALLQVIENTADRIQVPLRSRQRDLERLRKKHAGHDRVPGPRLH